MKALLPLALGLSGGILGAFLARALDADRAPERAAVERPAPAPLDDSAYRDLERRLLDAIDRRLESARTAPAPGARPAAEAAAQPDGEGLSEGARPATGAPADPGAQVADVVGWLRGRKLDSDATGRLFGWLSLHKDRIADVIAAIRKEVEADPRNPELRVALAIAHVADLTNNAVPGPQQGIIWAQALAAYDAAIEIEPAHWQARFGKAFGTGQVPEFLGQRPEAIRQFEELIEIQKARAPSPEFAATYFQLGTLYKDAGNVEKALEVWKEGARLFPENEELNGALEASTKK